MSNPVFRAKTNLTFAARTNSTLNRPAGVADGDILIVALVVDTTNVVVTPPAGWAEYPGSPFQYTVEAAGVQFSHHYWKRASSEPSSWTWTHSSIQTAALCMAYQGAKLSGDPNAVTATTNSGGADKNCVGLSISPPRGNALAILFSTYFATDGGRTPPAGYVEHGDPNVTYGAVDKLITPGAPTGNQTVVFVNNIFWFSFFVALSPEPETIVAGQSMGLLLALTYSIGAQQAAQFLPRLTLLGAG